MKFCWILYVIRNVWQINFNCIFVFALATLNSYICFCIGTILLASLQKTCYRVTQKKRSSQKIEYLPKFYLEWHKTSATLGQACVADISKVSSLYYKNSLFHWRSKKCASYELPGDAGTFGSGGQSSRWPSRIPPLGSLLLLLWLLPSGQG